MLARASMLAATVALLLAATPLSTIAQPAAALPTSQPAAPPTTSQTVAAFPAQPTEGSDVVPYGAGWRRSAPLEADGPFSMVALKLPHDGAAKLRTSADGATWSDWVETERLGEEQEGPDRGVEDRAAWQRWSEPVWVGAATWIQVATERGAPEQVAATLIDSAGLRRNAFERAARGGAASVAEAVLQPAAAATASTAPFDYQSRAEWGANESWVRRGPSYTDTIQFGVLHHTAGPNGYAPQDGPAVVRGIFHYHAVTLGWNDIGYNFLVDRYGQIYEGRRGGIERGVIGAHAQGFNSASFGVSVMGTFESGGLTDAAARAVADVFRWKFRVHGVDPSASVRVVSQGSNKWQRGRAVTLNAVSGHRDLGLTSCPGSAAYGELARLRERIRTPSAKPAPRPVPFTDIADTSHRSAIEQLAADGVTAGCGGDRYCPQGLVTRGQMASFVARAARLSSATATRMPDVTATSPHATSVAAAVDAGVVAGYPDGTFRPRQTITRGQMATMLTRALHLDAATVDRFADTAGSVHRAAINAVAAAEITRGCDDGRFCPADPVTRGQMASFLDRSRAAGLGEHSPIRFASQSPARWRVARVRSDDTLNVRAGPSTAYEVVGKLAPDATNIRGTDRNAAVGRSTWQQLVLGDGTVGWANRYYLAR